MDEDNVVTATQEGNVDLTSTDVTTDTTVENTGGEATNQTTESEPEKDMNSQAKEVRLAREALAKEQSEFSQIKRDMDIFKRYGTEYGFASEADIITQYGEQGITSLEDFELGLEADKAGVDPAIFKELAETKQTNETLKIENEAFRRKEDFKTQSEALKGDRIFKDAKDDIIALATKGNYDLTVARLLYIDQHPELINYDEGALKEKHIKEYIDGVRTGNKPTEGRGATAMISEPKDNSFGTARENALKRMRGQV